MFSKSKRFPDVDKDYIPGPGEYDLSCDDSGRHKRYGFLTQTNRFSEGAHHDASSESTSEFYISTTNNGGAGLSTTSSISSDTRMSSTNSNSRTTEDCNSPMTTSPTLNKSNNNIMKKLTTPMSPSTAETTTNSQQFEKYRYTMQKDLEALQIKCRKMESMIQLLENEKNDTKSILLLKDLELADLRSKNATLQKSINRQEKSSKSIQLQKKVEQLEIELHQKLDAESNRSSFIITNLEKIQQEKIKQNEALEAQVALLSVQLSESKNSATRLQQELKRIETTNMTLMQDLETCKNETQSLETLNNELMTQLQVTQENITQLESCIILKDEEILALLEAMDERDRTIQDKSNLAKKLQIQFKTYRNWMEHTVVPHLRSQRKAVEEHHYTELNQLLTELHEAKRFMNRQAQYLDGLKSDVHWLTVQNQQLSDILHGMGKERTEQYNLNKKRLFGFKQQLLQKKHQQKKSKQGTDDDDLSDTISFSS